MTVFLCHPVFLHHDIVLAGDGDCARPGSRKMRRILRAIPPRLSRDSKILPLVPCRLQDHLQVSAGLGACVWWGGGRGINSGQQSGGTAKRRSREDFNLLPCACEASGPFIKSKKDKRKYGRGFALIDCGLNSLSLR